jgi:dipeptidyl-peptidase-4
VITRAPALHGRVLIVYGTYDDNVHPQNSEAFIDALVKAGKQFDVMVYPMRMHGISDLDATRHLYRMMIEFWKKNL